MKSKRLIAAAALPFALAAYLALDIADVAPGFLTTDPPISEPAARPTPVLLDPVAEVDRTPHPVPAQNLDAAVAQFVRSPELGDLSLELWDVATGQRVAAYRETAPGPPASSTKVLTGAATLSELGPTQTLKTKAVLDGDTVVLVGGGDLMLGVGARSVGANGRASLTDLAIQSAAALREVGVSEVALAVDDTLFAGPGPLTWTAGDYRWAIEMRPMAMYGGLDEQEYAIKGDHALLVAQQFATELAAQGIAIAGEPGKGTASDAAEPIGIIESAPIEEVNSWMLKTSSNSVAEALARLVAISRGEGNTAEAGAAAVVAEVGELGVDIAGMHLADTAGLDSGNLVTVAQLTQVVRLALSGDEPVLRSMIPGFPVSYLDGTLYERISGAAGDVRAKTGTISRAMSLTGIVQADSGAALLFSIMATNLEPGGYVEARQVVDEFMVELRENA